MGLGGGETTWDYYIREEYFQKVKKWYKKEINDTSRITVSQVLAMQTKGPEVDPQYPHKKLVVGSCDPSGVEVETRGFLGLRTASQD